MGLIQYFTIYSVTSLRDYRLKSDQFSTCSHASIVLFFSNPHPPHLKKMKEEMKPYSKMEKLIHKDCTKMEEYITEKSLEDVRLDFKWQTGMLD